MQGHPNPSFLPVDRVREAFGAAFSDYDAGRALLQYGSCQGNPALRKEISDLLKSKAKRKNITPGEILITTGGGPGLSLVCHLFTAENDVSQKELQNIPSSMMCVYVANFWCTVQMTQCLYYCVQTIFVDSPAYFLSFNSFRDSALNPVEIATDESGIDVDEVEARLRAGARPTLLYTVPIANNPTGVNLCDSRRERLVQLSREFNFKIGTSDFRRFFQDSLCFEAFD